MVGNNGTFYLVRLDLHPFASALRFRNVRLPLPYQLRFPAELERFRADKKLGPCKACRRAKREGDHAPDGGKAWHHFEPDVLRDPSDEEAMDAFCRFKNGPTSPDDLRVSIAAFLQSRREER